MTITIENFSEYNQIISSNPDASRMTLQGTRQQFVS